MYGEAAFELVKELHRSQDILPPMNDEGVRRVVEEIQMIYSDNLREIRELSVDNVDDGVADTLAVRHVALERNMRCLNAYFYNRLKRIRQMRWELGSILPPEVKANMSNSEIEWFQSYNRNLATYMSSIGGRGGLNLTSARRPPKDLYIEVRCLMDFGKFELNSGEIVLLKRNAVYLLPRAECEALIRQGVLQEI